MLNWFPHPHPRVEELAPRLYTNCAFVWNLNYFPWEGGMIGNDQTVHFWHVPGMTKAFEKHHGLNYELSDLPVRFRYPDNGLTKHIQIAVSLSLKGLVFSILTTHANSSRNSSYLLLKSTSFFFENIGYLCIWKEIELKIYFEASKIFFLVQHFSFP